MGQNALRGALGSALTQGVGVVTGLQSRFDFAGVAAAGVGAGAGSWIGGELRATSLTDMSARNIAANVGTGTARALAGAATRSVLAGTDFGDNIMRALPDVIGSTIGQMAADGIAGIGRSSGKPIDLLAEVKDGSYSSSSGAGAMPDDLPPADGVQGGEEIVVTGRRSNATLLVPQGYNPVSMMTNVFYRDTTGRFLPTDEAVLEWAKPRTSLLTRLLDPSNLKWVRRGSGIGALGEILFDAAPAGIEYSIPIFGETGTLEYTAPNLFDGYSIVNDGETLGFAPRTDLANVFLIEKNGLPATNNGNNAFVMRTIDVGGEQIQVGFGVSIQSRREGEIYNEGIANGWSNDRINNAIAAERAAPIDGGGDFRLSDMRYVPGTAFNSGTLADADHTWLRSGSGAVPEQVAARLRGREFNSFDAFREEYWKTVADIPDLAVGFSRQNLGRMRNGNAPYTLPAERLGKQSTFQIHHPEQIRYGGAVYDMSNMLVVTPRIHNNLHNGPNR